MELVLKQTRNFRKSIKQWLVAVFNSILEAQQKVAERRIAESHLYRMTDRELRDVGITRNDIKNCVKK